MKSIYKFIWSEESLINLQGIIDYLNQNWTEKEVSNFAKLLDKKLTLLQSNPHLFPQSQISEELRRMVLSKQTSIHFRIKDTDIHIVTLFDTRQNPDKLSQFKPE
jgi:plasmid stabilization system protein ParE